MVSILDPQGEQMVITEAAIDSRQVIPGSMFVALPGERVDGHDYVGDAFNRGANLALVQRDLSGQFPTIDLRPDSSKYLASVTPIKLPEPPFCLLVEDSLIALQKTARTWRRKLDLRVIGITGSVGKSTTKELVAGVLSQRYYTLKNPGNLNNEIGLPLTLVRLGGGHERAVVEMGFYIPGEITFLCDLALPAVGVLTNIGTVHAERAGSQEAIAKGKAELVQALPAAPEGIAILNYDDPWIRPMAQLTHARIFYYGLDPECAQGDNEALWADEIEGLGLEGIRFLLHHHYEGASSARSDEQLNLRVPLIGRHSVQTALRAAAVGLVEGLTWQEIVAGLQQGHTQLRMVAVRSDTGALLLDDTYNASPESTLAALNLLGEMEGKRVGVLGDMLELGPYEKQGHEMVGVRAAEICHELITVGKRGYLIAQAAQQAGLPKIRIHNFEDIPETIEFLRNTLKEGDVVLVKGSHGLRMDRIIAALEGNAQSQTQPIGSRDFSVRRKGSKR